MGRLTPTQRLRRRAEDALAAQGLHEIVGWSFTGPELARASCASARRRLAADARQPDVLRAIAAADDAARIAAGRGRAQPRARRGQARAVRVRRGLPGKDDQRRASSPRSPTTSGLLAGPVRTATWRDQHPQQADFFAAKGVLAGLLAALGVDWDVRPLSRRSRFCIPAAPPRCLSMASTVGWLGEIHPNVAAQWDFEDTVAGFEIELSAITPPDAVKFQDLVSFPDVHEDLAIVVGESGQRERSACA